MTDVAWVNADIAALRLLSDGLRRFAFDQREVLERSSNELATALVSLTGKAQRWQAELEARRWALDACHQQAAAAQDGYGIDCTNQQFAVDQAYEYVATIRQWLARVEDAAEAYVGPRQRLSRLVDFGVPGATQFLGRTVRALETAHRTQVRGS